MDGWMKMGTVEDSRKETSSSGVFVVVYVLVLSRHGAQEGERSQLIPLFKDRAALSLSLSNTHPANNPTQRTLESRSTNY